MNILRVRAVRILNFKSARSLLSTLLVRPARDLLCIISLKLGEVGKNDSEDRRIFADLSQDVLYRSRILSQSMANK
jgi:hypothetical protein